MVLTVLCVWLQPLADCVIADCGELPADTDLDAVLAAQVWLDL